MCDREIKHDMDRVRLDHTLSTATGHFLYVDTTGRSQGEEAHLASPSYKGSQPRCLRIWYHLYGAGPGTLQIQQKPEIGRAKTLWTKSNDQGMKNIRIPLDNVTFLWLLFV